MSGRSGVDIWYLQSLVAGFDGQEKAYATVVYEPAITPEYCLAQSLTFIGNSAVGEPLVWNLPEDEKISYRFWFESCDRTSPESAIVLKSTAKFRRTRKHMGRTGVHY